MTFQISLQEIESLLKQYTIGKYVFHKKFEKGVANYNFKLQTTTGTYLLKVYKDRSKSQIDFEIKLLRTLKGCVVQQPIKGKRYQAQLQQKPCVIFSYIQGTHKLILKVKQLYKVGEELAKIHLATANLKPKQLQKKYSYSKKWVRELLDDLQTKYPDFPKSISSFIKNTLQTIQTPALRRGIIHGDLHNENLLFQNDLVVGIIDFDDCNIATLLVDIGCVISYLCINHNTGIHFEKIKSFLQGYELIRPLTHAEKNHLYDYTVLFTLIHILYHMYDKKKWNRNIRVKKRLSVLLKEGKENFQKRILQ